MVRDFFRELQKNKTQKTATKEGETEDKTEDKTEGKTEGAATEPATPQTTALKPRDETFMEVTKQVVIAFRDAEREYLKNLDKEIVAKICESPDGNPDGAVGMHMAHLRHYLHVLLTLKGLKPATLFFVGHHSFCATQAINGVVIKCLVPLLERYDIESYGFKLHYSPGFHRNETGEGFWGAWVLADVKSPEWPQVNSTFFNRRQDVSADVLGMNLGPLLGYPVRHELVMDNLVMFLDETERDHLNATLPGHYPYVCALSFLCGQGREYPLDISITVPNQAFGAHALFCSSFFACKKNSGVADLRF